MIVWQGLGAYGFVIPFFVWFAVQIVARLLLGEEGAARWGQFISGISLLASAVLVYVVGQRLDARPGREMIDKATGAEVTLRERHTLFFAPLRYVAVFWAIVGAILVVVGLQTGLA